MKCVIKSSIPSVSGAGDYERVRVGPAGQRRQDGDAVRGDQAFPCHRGQGSCLQVSAQSVMFIQKRARCSSVVRAFTHGAMGHRIDPS